MSDQQSGLSRVIPHPEEHEAQPQYSDPYVPGPSSQRIESWRCSVCGDANPENAPTCVKCGADCLVVPIKGNDASELVSETVPAMKTTGLTASLRQTADSVAERLLSLAKTDEEPQEFTDDIGESSALALHRLRTEISTGDIIFADESSSCPLTPPDETSIQGIFRETSGLTKSEEKEQIDPQSPPHVDRIGSEVRSSSPQPQPPKESMEQPWEMPQHVPDLTATETPTKHSLKNDGDGNTEDGISPAQRLTRLLVCCAVVLALFLSLWFMPQNDSDSTLGSPGVRVTLSPTLAPTTSGMTQPTQPSSLSPTSGTQSPTTASATIPPPTTPPPSSSPIFGTLAPSTASANTRSPTFVPTTFVTTQPPVVNTPSPTTTNSVNPPTTDNFTSQASFQGATDGTRLGLGVSLDQSGGFFAALDGRGNVQLYQQDSNTTGSGWSFVSTVVATSTQPVESMDLVVVNGIPQVALASPDLIQVLDYRNDAWNSLGNVPWTPASGGVTSPIVAQSASGATLAVASLENGGSNWNVQVWEWNSTWVPKGLPVIHNSTSNPFLSLSLDIAGDGETLVIGDWTIAALAVTVNVYRWNDPQGWSSLGSSPSFSWGPVAVTMRNDGQSFAVATPPPSSALVYEWNKTSEDWEVVGNNLLGGTAIALADNGRRVVVGSPLTSSVYIYDQSSNGSWQTTAVLNSTIGDQFGSSITVGGDGNVLVVGSPLDDQGGSNAGQVSVYA